MQVLELKHVALHVSDLYQNTLRLEPLPRPAFKFRSAWFQLGKNQELHLIGVRDEPCQSHNRGNHFALRVGNLDEPRKRRPDGAWQVFVHDPDGHFVELFTGP